MNNKEKLELAKWAVTQAKGFGADEAAVDVANSREIEIECRDQKIDKLQEATQNSMTVRIYTKGRYSSNTTNDMRKDSLSKFIEEASSAGCTFGYQKGEIAQLTALLRAYNV